jgi:hypothetical protein
MKRLSIKITSNAKTLSSYSDLHVFANLFQNFEIQALTQAYLPKKKRNSGWKSSEKLYAGVLGFIAGAECLDDFDWLGNDPLFRDMTNAPSSTTMGKFLRNFSPRQIEQVRNSLPTLAMKQRIWQEPQLHKIVFRMDATTHEQYGEKMENAINVVPRGVKKYFVADSGYSSLAIYNQLITKQVHFAICLGEKEHGDQYSKIMEIKLSGAKPV